MILQLQLEEELAKESKLRGRMSCVNNSDILRSARNALNQYPRFSLDGKDAMYRSSFRNLNGLEKGRKSVCCDQGLRERLFYGSNGVKSAVAGESVIWCKPGVVAKLMGLDAMPVPTNSKEGKEVSCIIRRQNLRRRAERHEMERRIAMNHHGRIGFMFKGCSWVQSCEAGKSWRRLATEAFSLDFRIIYIYIYLP
ncbi:hypothetical protein Patl1_30077 [Pistacia atlantica]|uniref:Uncharacterized protein n=1 Tax=Pistacia atlantica TaxID=434234 RepID=A0ACC1ABM9_9ROSI|nr:hypothetical protein Patl1_30077 [Pistacia atlantica]